MKKYLTRIVVIFISVLDIFVPKNNNFVVYNSFPDLSDNAFALFVYILEHYPDKKNIWLVKKLDLNRYQSIIHDYRNYNTFKIVKRDSLLGVYYYLRSKYVFFTHGLFGGSRISKQHCVVNLWHGMPLKKIGLLGNTEVVQNSKYVIATSIFYQEIMANALGVEKQNVLIVGQPRNDLMFKNNNCLGKLGLLNNKGDKIILWTPTFRQSVIGDIRVDGLSTNDFPVIKSSELVKLNRFLRSIKSFMIIKLHPMDALNRKEFNNYSNIRIIKKDELEFYNCQLYSLLGKIDILLTDFSSIYIDYLLLNRPIGFVVDDLSEYSNSRGFIFDHPEKYMPGKKISTLDELKDFLYSSIVLKEKFFLNEHNQVNMKFNKVFTSYSNELLKAINFK